MPKPMFGFNKLLSAGRGETSRIVVCSQTSILEVYDTNRIGQIGLKME